jgi:HEAT repeat protein
MSLTPDAAVKRIVDDSSDLAAYETLIAAGEKAARAILVVLEKSQSVPTMTALLSLIGLADPVATLEPLLASKAGSVGPAALSALARVDDPRVVGLIEKRLPRRIAIDALGDHGDPKAQKTIRALVTPIVGESGEKLPTGPGILSDDDLDLDLVVSAAIALAKLGDHSLAPVVIRLATLVDPKDPDSRSDLRVAATIGLSYVVAPGVAAAICKTLSDPSEEVISEGLRSSLHLGRVAEAEGFMQVLRSDGPLAAIATWYLEAWSASHPTGRRDKPVTGAQLDKWWSSVRSNFSPNVCYRHGKPIDLDAMIDKLPDDPLHLRDELRVRTGAGCFLEDLAGNPVSKPELSAIKAWWKANASKFPPGKLHRWGRTYVPGAVDSNG